MVYTYTRIYFIFNAVLCPWARHFTPRKYWLITQEAVAPSRHDWKIVDWDAKPQHKQNFIFSVFLSEISRIKLSELLTFYNLSCSTIFCPWQSKIPTKASDRYSTADSVRARRDPSLAWETGPLFGTDNPHRSLDEPWAYQLEREILAREISQVQYWCYCPVSRWADGIQIGTRNAKVTI